MCSPKRKHVSVNKGVIIGMLPDELLIDILTQLPGKQIVRCKCVCKAWRSVISSRPFRDIYRSRQSGLLLYWSEEELDTRNLRFFHCPLRRHDEPPGEFTPLPELKLEREAGKGHPILKGVTQLIDGLLCVGENSRLIFNSNFRLTIYNVCTRESMRVQDPSFSPWLTSAYHLGYDPVSRVYKLLRLMFNCHKSVKQAHIMTLMPPSGPPSKWRVLNDFRAGISGLSSCTGGLSEARTLREDGLLCWFRGTNRCVFFDLNTEIFTVLELPQDVRSESKRVMKLLALNRFNHGLALWVAFYEEKFTVISCYIQEDDSEKTWRILKEFKKSGRFAFAGNLPSSSSGGEMILVDLKPPRGLKQRRRVYSYSYSHSRTELTLKEDVLFVGRLPEGAPALNKHNISYNWQRCLVSAMGRLSCLADGGYLYLPLEDILGGASAAV